MDWRIGKRVTFKLRTDPLWGHHGTIIDTAPSGRYGIDDRDGALIIKLDCGETVMVAADRCRTSGRAAPC